ncbi:MAG TPA: LysM peptidoglycan-binding domain-containing protein [Ktedonobacteraceae bacterium]|nr:LysM peptidoglycan-binding domain-containing protein [Ktedonobacteraceae bacterium]
MQTYQRIWSFRTREKEGNEKRLHLGSPVIRRVVVITAILGMILAGSGLSAHMMGAFAKSACASGDQVYSVVSGDTLGGIATRYHTTWQRLASYNHIANPNIIYLHQTICIPGKAQPTHKPTPVRRPAPVKRPTGPPPIRGTSNYFPYGQCTWWASYRYFQLHGIYVPWKTQADAWEWTARARDSHWRISSTPSQGVIINLQPWVEGAYNLGHVAVVEKVLKNGHVIASNMNWGASYWEVTYVEFVPGPGVTFISF